MTLTSAPPSLEAQGGRQETKGQRDDVRASSAHMRLGTGVVKSLGATGVGFLSWGALKTRRESLMQKQLPISPGHRLASATFQDAGFPSQLLSNAEKPGHSLAAWTTRCEVGAIIPEPLTF